MDSINPALEDIVFMEGEWKMEVFNASFLPDPNQKVLGKVNFKSLQGGAVLVMEQEQRIFDPHASSWIIGRDETSEDYTVLYYAKGNASRVYEMSFHRDTWKLWRNESKFYQRFVAKVDKGRKTISSYWETSQDDGITWHHDFDMIYTRI